MPPSSPVEALARLPMLRDAPRSELVMLLNVGQWVEVPKGGELCRQGELADHGMLIVEGRLKAWVYEGTRERAVSDVYPGELVGEAGLYAASSHRTATLRAFADSRALRLTRASLEAMGGTETLAAIQHHMLAAMARRLRTTNHAIRRQWRLREEQQADAAETPKQQTAWGKLKRFLGELA
jgi:CRP-like cAMP-binding protein